MKLTINPTPQKTLRLRNLNVGDYFTFTDRNMDIVLRRVEGENSWGVVSTALVVESGIRRPGEVLGYFDQEKERPVRRLRVLSMEFEEV